jgi:hypothetical protein
MKAQDGQGENSGTHPSFLALEGKRRREWGGGGVHDATKLIIIAFPWGTKDQLPSAVRQIILILEASA